MKTLLAIVFASLLIATLTFAGPIEDPKLIYFMNDTPNVIELLEARIAELEKQVKELQGRSLIIEDEISYPVMCTNFNCYDSNGRKVSMWEHTLKDQVVR